MRTNILLTLCALASNALVWGLLYTVGPDPSTFAPNVFTKINANTQVTTPLFNLGKGSVGINGGVAFSPDSNLFYTMSNDSNGAYGVQPDHYAAVGSALVNTLTTALGDRFPEQTQDAWMDLYTYLSLVMEKGARDAASGPENRRVK